MPSMGSGSFRLYLGLGTIVADFWIEYIEAGTDNIVDDAEEWATINNSGSGGLLFQTTQVDEGDPFPTTTGTADFFVGTIQLFSSTPSSLDGTYASINDIPVAGLTPLTAQLSVSAAPVPSESLPASPWGTVSLRLDAGEVASLSADDSGGETLSYTFPNVGLTGRPESFVLLTSRQMGVEITNTDWYVGVSGLGITGTYELIQSWWQIPDVDACGNRQTSHLALSADAPTTPTGVTWERFDPDDPDAAPTPTILTLTSDHGLAAGGETVTITGEGFGDDATVTVDGAEPDDVVIVSQYAITFTAPAHAVGDVDVVVTNEDDVASDPATYTYEDRIVEIDTVEPSAGGTAGGTEIAITGRGFLTGATVEVGGVAATDVVVVDEGRIMATTPAHSAATVDVVVTNTDASTATLDDGFEFRAAAPTLEFRYRVPSGMTSGVLMQPTPPRISRALAQPCTASFMTATEPTGEQLVQFFAQGVELFSGTVVRKAEVVVGADKVRLWSVDATDFTRRLARRHPTGTWINTSATTVIQQLIASFAPGFSAVVESGLNPVTLLLDGTADLWAAIVDVCNRAGAKAFLTGTTVRVFTVTATGITQPAAVTPTNPDLLWPSGDQQATIDTDYTTIRNRVTVRGAEGLSVTVDHAGSIASYGMIEYVINDNTLESVEELIGRAQAELDALALPIPTVRYATRDLNSLEGRTVAIALTNPAISGNFLIRAVEIDQLDLLRASPVTKPRLTVTAVPAFAPAMRRGDLVGIVQQVIDLKANALKQPKLDGDVTSTPGGRVEIPEGSIPASKLAGCIPGTALLEDAITLTQIAPEVFDDMVQEPGTRADQPEASAVPPGTLYFVTDEDVLERSNGTTWEPYSAISGGSPGGSPAAVHIFADGSEPFAAPQSMGGFALIDVEDPTDPQDAATKAYVDSLVGSPGGGGSGFIFIPPDDTGFAWVNQGSATLDVIAGDSISILDVAGGTTDANRLRVKTAPATPYVVTAYLDGLIFCKQFMSFGLVLRDSVSGKIVRFGCAGNAGGSFLAQLQKLTSPTVFSSTYLEVDAGRLMKWFRIADDGTTRVCSLSEDGTHWLAFYSVGRTDFTTPDQVGFYANSMNVTTPNLATIATLRSWEEA